MSGVQIRLKVIPKPKEGTRTVLVGTFNGPIFTNGGAYNYVCGACGTVLASNLQARHVIRNIVVQCYGCGKYVEFP